MADITEFTSKVFEWDYKKNGPLIKPDRKIKINGNEEEDDLLVFPVDVIEQNKNDNVLFNFYLNARNSYVSASFFINSKNLSAILNQKTSLLGLGSGIFGSKRSLKDLLRLASFIIGKFKDKTEKVIFETNFEGTEASLNFILSEPKSLEELSIKEPALTRFLATEKIVRELETSGIIKTHSKIRIQEINYPLTEEYDLGLGYDIQTYNIHFIWVCNL